MSLVSLKSLGICTLQWYLFSAACIKKSTINSAFAKIEIAAAGPRPRISARGSVKKAAEVLHENVYCIALRRF